MRPSGVTITLLGFTSRWSTPWEWAWSSATATWRAIRRQTSLQLPEKSGGGGFVGVVSLGIVRW